MANIGVSDDGAEIVVDSDAQEIKWIVRGGMVADVISAVASIDPVMGGVDR